MIHGFRILFEYICDNSSCRMLNLFPLKEAIVDLTELGVIAERHKPERCYICNWGMRVKKAVIQRIAKQYHPFGHPTKGFWLCPAQCGVVGRVYPLPLQYAVESVKERTVLWPSIYIHKYETIAKAGYPWKCPACSQQLEYIEEETSKNG